MKQQDDEKELVLGNKQLISLFFVAAALCGVFFAMGYMMGRNTTKPASGTGTEAPVTESRPEGQRSQPTPEFRDGENTAATTPAGSETHPAVESPAPTTPAVETRPVETPKEEPKPVETRARTAERDPLALSTPEAGAQYLQVAALPRPEAESMVRSLREQKFPVIMTLSSKEGFYRVMVGPYRQTIAVSDAKSKLKALGFANPLLQKP
jgi:cell division septation protein DedD